MSTGSPVKDAQVLIRRARPADAADIVQLMSAEDVHANLMQLPWPDEATWRKRLEGHTDPDNDHLLLVAEVGGRVVGNAGLHPQAKLRRRHVAMMGISVALEAQGRGVGSALMEAVCSYADRWAQVLRIELTVFADNTRAIALYRRFGFVHEGTHRAFALRQGVYADVHSMARLHPCPPVAAWPAP